MLMREGNMGDKYEETRHNIGWMAADRIQANPELQFDQWQSRYSGMIAKGVNPKDGCTLWVLKPLTFMNLSGCSVATAAEGLGLGLGDICVMHDDIDLAPGRVKMKRGGSTAGHNGLKSINAELSGSGEWDWRDFGGDKCD
eukprot:TRINITY_DN61033_c0_g2_i1.p1 TRINITY_DN61033_c0_g2~~TRINITY_DN61033_c0_g2_i1.p1  ORF type:complete len:141 (+),score=25.30 TRINITY_DN61033_c0_g2_i1:151-573(+)